MDWKTYYDRFGDWEESTQLRHLSSLTDFGPSSEVCELANDFFEEKSATRLIKKALAAGVRFTAEEVLELDGVVDKSLMLPLIQSVPSLKAEDLDALSFWLTQEDLKALAKKHHVRLDEYGYVMTAEDEALEREFQREEEEARREEELLEKEVEQMRAEQAAREKEEFILARWLIAISRKRRRERRKKRRNG